MTGYVTVKVRTKWWVIRTLFASFNQIWGWQPSPNWHHILIRSFRNSDRCKYVGLHLSSSHFRPMRADKHTNTQNFLLHYQNRLNLGGNLVPENPNPNKNYFWVVPIRWNLLHGLRKGRLHSHDPLTPIQFLPPSPWGVITLHFLFFTINVLLYLSTKKHKVLNNE